MNRRKFISFPVSLIVVCAGLAISNCSKTADQSAQLQRGSIAKLLDAYIGGYTTGDYTSVRFAADVTFEGPMTNGKILESGSTEVSF